MREGFVWTGVGSDLPEVGSNPEVGWIGGWTCVGRG